MMFSGGTVSIISSISPNPARVNETPAGSWYLIKEMIFLWEHFLIVLLALPIMHVGLNDLVQPVDKQSNNDELYKIRQKCYESDRFCAGS